MNARECPREAEVLDAVSACRWPHKVEVELRAHVARCAVCADVADVLSAFQADLHGGAVPAPVLPPPELVWLRAQARARAEAARRATRPVVVMQALGFAAVTAVLSGLIGLLASWLWPRIDALAILLPTFGSFEADALRLALRGTLIAIGFWLILAPVAVYLVAAEE